MRRLVVGLALVSGAACLDFDARVDAGCDLDAGWAECRGGADGGGGEDAGALGWRWENPLPLGANDLYAVWGASDSDVWVAGTGPTLAHLLDGAWTDERSRLALPPPTLEDPPAAVRAVAVSDAGVVWLGGDRMPLVGLLPDGGRVAGSPSWGHVVGASGHGVVAFARTSSNAIVLELPFADGRPAATFSLPLSSYVNLRGITVTATDVLVAYDNDRSEGQVWSLTAGTAASLLFDGGLPCPYVSAFAQDRGVPVVSCGDGGMFEQRSGGWAQRASPVEAPVGSHQFERLADGGTAWWLTGLGGYVARSDASGTITLGVDSQDYSFGSWLSPERSFWVVGTSGRVGVVTAGRLEERGARPQPQEQVRDLALRGTHAVALGTSGGRWVRNSTSGAWAYDRIPGGPSVRAVALRPDGGVCRLDDQAMVTCGNTAVRTLELDGGRAFDSWRGAGLDVSSTGELRAAIGGAIALQGPGDAGWLTGPHPGGQQHTAQVIGTDDGMWVACNEATGDYQLGAGAVYFVGFTGITAPCATPGSVMGIALYDGGVLAVGHDFVGTCVDGLFTSVPTPGSFWTSAWVDGAGRWWVVDYTGRVLRREVGDDTWTVEDVPLSSSDGSNGRVTRIIGNDRELFLVGKGGGILRRPLP